MTEERATDARFAGHVPSAGRDTGGVPWTGRTLQPTGFEGDEGHADPALATVLERLDPRRGADAEQIEAAQSDLARALAGARLLAPVVAEPSADGGEGDMAAPTLIGADGTRALPVFTDLASLSRWDARARPVPVTAQRAALAAVQERCSHLVLDAADRAVVVRSSMLWALAQDRTWTPAHQDDQVRRAVERAVADQRPAELGSLGAGPGGALRIEVLLPPGLDADGVRSLVTAVGEALASDGEVRARIDAVSFAVRPQG